MKKIAVVLMLALMVVIGGSVDTYAYSTTSTVRSLYSEYTIDDDGRFTNPFDKVNFEAETGKTIAEWKALGYNDVKIKITLDMREVNNGYQYVFVYQEDWTTGTGNYLFHTETIEHGGSGLETDWDDYDFYMLTIDLDDIDDGELFIRYGASGSWSDDWKNRNIRVTFEFDY